MLVLIVSAGPRSTYRMRSVELILANVDDLRLAMRYAVGIFNPVNPDNLPVKSSTGSVWLVH